MIIQTYEQNPQPRAIRTAVEVVRDGGLIVYPTDTIYGLGCDLHNKRALEKLYRIKGMVEKSPLSFISPDLSRVSRYAQVGNRAYRIMNKCLPGPFTFILPAMKEVNRYMLYKRRQIGIRVPASNVCRMLTQELGNPIVNTSVPLWREKVLNSGEVIDEYFGAQIDLVLDIGVLVSEPSTIVDLSGDEFAVTRQGKGEITL
jgi:tRNA threonylcarbamoyl adenosine modification protein (Sua5/YciO/YrdC/YwlC family)